MYDANVVLQTLTTQATAYTETAVDLKTGTPRRGLKARLIVSSYTLGAGTSVLTPRIEHSDDNTTFVTLVTGIPISATTATGSTVDYLSFDTSKRYVRLVMGMSVVTGTPAVVYKADLGISRPGPA